jgi:hypothetical protein
VNFIKYSPSLILIKYSQTYPPRRTFYEWLSSKVKWNCDCLFEWGKRSPTQTNLNVTSAHTQTTLDLLMSITCGCITSLNQLILNQYIFFSKLCRRLLKECTGLFASSRHILGSASASYPRLVQFLFLSHLFAINVSTRHSLIAHRHFVNGLVQLPFWNCSLSMLGISRYVGQPRVYESCQISLMCRQASPPPPS